MNKSGKLSKRIRQLILLCSLCVITGNHTFAQSGNQPYSSLINQHTVFFQPKQVTVKAFSIPASLITFGALRISGEIFIADPEVKEERDENFKNFRTGVDNYLQFAPIAAGYALLINNKQHRFWKYTEKIAITEVVVTGLVQLVKHITKVPRPDTGEPTSFPSGHTAQAFAGAVIFCDEFAQHNTWLTLTVYTGAAAVGALRVLNNRYRASDVIAGAGFGILSAKLHELIAAPHGKKIHQSYSYQL